MVLEMLCRGVGSGTRLLTAKRLLRCSTVLIEILVRAASILIVRMTAAVAWSELILRIGTTSISLIDGQLRLVGVLVRPLSALLILDHLLHFETSWLGQMALRVKRCIRR